MYFDKKKECYATITLPVLFTLPSNRRTMTAIPEPDKIGFTQCS